MTKEASGRKSARKTRLALIYCQLMCARPPIYGQWTICLLETKTPVVQSPYPHQVINLYSTPAREPVKIHITDPSGGLQLAGDILTTLPPNTWLRTLEDPDVDIDLASSTRQDWSDSMPMLLQLELFNPP